VNTGDLVNRMNFALGLSSDRIPGRADGLDSIAGAAGGQYGACGVDDGTANASGERKGTEAGDVAPWTGGERPDAIDVLSSFRPGNAAAGDQEFCRSRRMISSRWRRC